MINANTIKVKDIIKSNIACNIDNADILFNIIDSYLKDNKSINVSFEGIDIMINAFLGDLLQSIYEKYSVKFINKHIEFVNFKRIHLESYNIFIINIKKYYIGK